MRSTGTGKGSGAAAGRRPAGRLAGRLRLGLHHRVQPQAPHPPPRVPARPRTLPPPASRHPPRRPPREHTHMLPLQPPPRRQKPQSRKHPVLPVQLHLRPARYHVRMDRVGPAVAHQRGESRFMLHRRSRSCRAGSLEVSRRASSRQGTAESVEEDGREGRRPV